MGEGSGITSSRTRSPRASPSRPTSSPCNRPTSRSVPAVPILDAPVRAQPLLANPAVPSCPYLTGPRPRLPCHSSTHQSWRCRAEPSHSLPFLPCRSAPSAALPGHAAPAVPSPAAAFLAGPCRPEPFLPCPTLRTLALPLRPKPILPSRGLLLRPLLDLLDGLEDRTQFPNLLVLPPNGLQFAERLPQ